MSRICSVLFQGLENVVGRDNGDLPLETRDASGPHDLPTVAIRCGSCKREIIIEGEHITLDDLRRRGWSKQVEARYDNGAYSCRGVGWIVQTRWVCQKCVAHGKPAVATYEYYDFSIVPRGLRRMEKREISLLLHSRWCCGS